MISSSVRDLTQSREDLILLSQRELLFILDRKRHSLSETESVFPFSPRKTRILFFPCISERYTSETRTLFFEEASQSIDREVLVSHPDIILDFKAKHRKPSSLFNPNIRASERSSDSSVSLDCSLLRKTCSEDHFMTRLPLFFSLHSSSSRFSFNWNLHSRT